MFTQQFTLTHYCNSVFFDQKQAQHFFAHIISIESNAFKIDQHNNFRANRQKRQTSHNTLV